MDLLSVFKKYRPIILLMAIGYVVIAVLYYFFGYGKIVVDQKAYTFIDNIPYGQNQNIKLRPGTYIVRSQTPKSSFSQTLHIYPFWSSTVSFKQSDYANIVKSQVPSGSTLNITKTKLLNDKWLVAYASNDEIDEVLVFQFQDGSWLEIASYTLPENQQSINRAYFDKTVPQYVSNYIKQDLLK